MTGNPSKNEREGPELDELNAEDQVAMQAFFRQHVVEGGHYNKAVGFRVSRWDADGVTVELPLREDLTAHTGVFHGGVVSALIDTAGCGSVMAGHDFNQGSRQTTISLTVNFVSVAPGEGLVAEGRCTRRGRSTNFAEVHVFGADSRKLLAQGVLVTNISGHRDDFDRMLRRARRDAGLPLPPGNP